jgi:hypothetical protein
MWCQYKVKLALIWNYSGTTVELQWNYSGTTVELQWNYSGIQWNTVEYSGTTVELLWNTVELHTRNECQNKEMSAKMNK